MKQLFIVFSVLLALLSAYNTSAQSLVDVSVGSSTQDRVSANVAYRYQLNDRFRIGLEAQYGAPRLVLRSVATAILTNSVGHCRPGCALPLVAAPLLHWLNLLSNNSKIILP
ncbi:MAG: hypothetical protein NW218_07545 [Saprospiraceae bacterium]|nr:hypothetical protein [Saprospiraceae bacterium]